MNSKWKICLSFKEIKVEHVQSLFPSLCAGIPLEEGPISLIVYSYFSLSFFKNTSGQWLLNCMVNQSAKWIDRYCSRSKYRYKYFLTKWLNVKQAEGCVISFLPECLLFIHMTYAQHTIQQRGQCMQFFSTIFWFLEELYFLVWLLCWVLLIRPIDWIGLPIQLFSNPNIGQQHNEVDR